MTLSTLNPKPYATLCNKPVELEPTDETEKPEKSKDATGSNEPTDNDMGVSENRGP